jgi:hypothetical protein
MQTSMTAARGRIVFGIFLLAAMLTASATFAQCPTCYHSPAAIDTFIAALVRDDSIAETHRVHVETIGHSRGQIQETVYDIKAVLITANADANPDKPSVLIVGQTHAEEVVGMEVALHYMWGLVHEQSNRFRTLLNTTNMWFVPTMNPDGLQIVTSGLDPTYRKNGYVPPGVDPDSCVVPNWGQDRCGVDLNRNFDINWVWGDTLWRPTGSEFYDYYRGPDPCSEPEAQAMRDLGRRIRPTVAIVFHASRAHGVIGNALTYQTIVPWEWGTNGGPLKFAPDSAAIMQIANGWCAKINEIDNHYFAVRNGTHNGAMEDWFYRNLGTMMMLPEMAPPVWIQPNADDLADLIQTDSASLDWLCRRPANLRGTGTDPLGPTPLNIRTRDAAGNPISAEYRNVNTWNAYLGPWFTSDSGRATLIPWPGDVTILARKEGYVSASALITVNPNQQPANLTLTLQPLPWHTVTLNLRNSAGEGIPGRVFVDGEFPHWFDVTAGGTNVSLPEGDYRTMAAATDENKMVLWRNFHLAGDVTEVFTLSGTSTVFTEDFENGLTNWTFNTQEGAWQLTSDSMGMCLASLDTFFAWSGAMWHVYQNNLNSSITCSQAINLTADSNVAYLDFYRSGRLDFPADSLFLEVSSDGGPWQVAAGYSDPELPWTHTYANLSAWMGHTIHFRFRIRTDDALGDRGIHIDRLRVLTGMDVATPDKPIPAAYTYKIEGSYPNPFNPSTTINYEVAQAGQATLVIFNTLGEEVRRFDVRAAAAGPQRLIWDGSAANGAQVSTGVYYVQLRGGGTISTHKMVLLR